MVTTPEHHAPKAFPPLDRHDLVEEAIAVYHTDGRPLPPATSGRDFANKMQSVA